MQVVRQQNHCDIRKRTLLPNLLDSLPQQCPVLLHFKKRPALMRDNGEKVRPAGHEIPSVVRHIHALRRWISRRVGRAIASPPLLRQPWRVADRWASKTRPTLHDRSCSLQRWACKTRPTYGLRLPRNHRVHIRQRECGIALHNLLRSRAALARRSALLSRPRLPGRLRRADLRETYVTDFRNRPR